ncbi:MAG: hypothetical protein ACO305_17185, partial [Rubrivivax sp.]
METSTIIGGVQAAGQPGQTRRKRAGPVSAAALGTGGSPRKPLTGLVHRFCEHLGSRGTRTPPPMTANPMNVPPVSIATAR